MNEPQDWSLVEPRHGPTGEEIEAGGLMGGRFCAACGWEKVIVASRPMFCESCSSFEITHERMRRHYKDALP